MKHRKKLAALSVTVLVCFAIGCGCAGVGAPDRNIGRDVAHAEFVGVWRLTHTSLRNLEARAGFKSDPAHAYTIQLEPNGVMKFASILHTDGEWEYLEGEGTWKQDVDWNNNRIITFEFPTKGGNSYQLTEGWARGLTWWTFLGDPDQWEFVEYTRDP